MAYGRLRILAVIVPIAALVLVAACGGGDDSSSKGSATVKTSIATKAPAGNDAPAAAEIDQDNLAFKPGKVTVKVGENVRFKNSESALHTVNINGKNISGNMKKGDLLIWTAPSAGTFKVSCDYHPQMSATITVQ